MAAKTTASTPGDYRKTEVYKAANSTKRRQLERYKADQKITDEHLFLLLGQQDLKDLPKEKKQEGNRPAELMVVGSIILFLVVTTTQQSKLLMLIASILVLVSAGFYFSGIMNPYSSALRRTRKRLKTFPTVPSFADWLAANPEPVAAAASKPQSNPAQSASKPSTQKKSTSKRKK